MNARRPFLAGALLLGALAAGALAAAKPGAADRRRIVQGWLVEAGPEEDGGRLVRISRTSGPYRLEFQAAYWHGNDGVIQRASALGESCGNDEALDRHLRYHVQEIRARLTVALAQCAATPDAVRSALDGLEPAYALAMAWDWEAAVASAPEPPPMQDPDEGAADARCDPADGAAERDIAEMNAMEAAEAAGC